MPFSCVADRVATDEALTERGAGRRAGRPRGLRGGPEIAPPATPLQNYITADFAVVAADASCECRGVTGRSVENGEESRNGSVGTVSIIQLLHFWETKTQDDDLHKRNMPHLFLMYTTDRHM